MISLISTQASAWARGTRRRWCSRPRAADRRWGWTPRDIVPDAAEAFLLDQTWQPASWRTVLGEAPHILDEAALRTAADRLAAQGLLLIEGEMLLALPLRDGLHRSPTWREIRA